MKKLQLYFTMAVCLLFAGNTAATEPAPRWVQKGVKSLNRERTDKNYRFCTFTTTGTDVMQLQTIRPLLEYIGKQYDVNPDAMQLDSLSAPGGNTTLLITFLSDGEPAEVQAQQIDSWTQFDDDIFSTQMQLSQLYAVSDKNTTPAFDNFTLTHKYGAKPVLMSVIPGVGQIYKGQRAKGYTILCSEAALLGVSIGTAVEVNHYKKLKKDNPGFNNSWDSKISFFRNLRNTSLIMAGGLYIYNLIDAAVAKGARRVIIKKPDQTAAEISFVPAVSPFGAGMGAVVRF